MNCSFSFLHAPVKLELQSKEKTGEFTIPSLQNTYGSSEQDFTSMQTNKAVVCLRASSLFNLCFQRSELKISIKISMHIKIVWRILCVQLPHSADWH